MTEPFSGPTSGGPDFAEIADRLRRDADNIIAGRSDRRRRRKAGIIAGVVAAGAAIGIAVSTRGTSEDSLNPVDTSIAASQETDGFTATTLDASVATFEVILPSPTEAPAATDTLAPPLGTVSSDPSAQTVPATEARATIQISPTTVVVTTTTTAPTTTAPTTTIAGTDVNAEASELPIRYAVYSAGKLYLRGKVPDQATADELTARAGSVLGAGNVFTEYQIDPNAPLPNSAPVYVQDTVLFPAGSAEIAGQYQGLLEIGVALLSQYPKVRIIVEGHTDDRGTDEYNMSLSQRRVDAILAYVERRGGDMSRVEGFARGESDPLTENYTPEGQQANRRIEFTIIDLLA